MAHGASEIQPELQACKNKRHIWEYNDNYLNMLAKYYAGARGAELTAKLRRSDVADAAGWEKLPYNRA